MTARPSPDSCQIPSVGRRPIVGREPQIARYHRIPPIQAAGVRCRHTGGRPRETGPAGGGGDGGGGGGGGGGGDGGGGGGGYNVPYTPPTYGGRGRETT